MSFGWKPNPLDARDFDEDKLGLAAAPKDGDILHMLGMHSTLNQAGSSSCTGHARVQEVVVAKRAAYKRQHPEVTAAQLRAMFPIGSPYFVYYGARRQEDPTGLVKLQDTGAYPRLAAKFVATFGVPPYSAWPNDTSKVNRKPIAGAWTKSMRPEKARFFFFRASGDARLDAIDAALAADKPVSFGTGVGSEMSGRTGEVVLGVPARIVGMHAMCIIGMRRVNGQRLYAVVQSYGADYGIDGIFWMTDEYLAWSTTSDVGCIDGVVS